MLPNLDMLYEYVLVTQAYAFAGAYGRVGQKYRHFLATRHTFHVYAKFESCLSKFADSVEDGLAAKGHICVKSCH